MAGKTLNSHQSTEQIATSEQPDHSQFHWIADEGYEVAINLAMHDSNNAIPEEGSLVASLGMQYINIPVPFEEPTVQHLEEFIGILKVLAKRRIWVHCEVNARASAFIFHYLTKVKGLPIDSANSPQMVKWHLRWIIFGRNLCRLPMMKWVFSTTLFLLSAAALADVTSKGDSGFTLVITGEVMTTPVEAYGQFIRIEEWWLEGHTWYGKGENLSIEPKADGCFCEKSGDNQVQHMLVSYVQPGLS